MNQEYLNVDNLSFEYPDGFKALENINLSLSKGERLAVLGPNGAGKTTLILHLNGILGDLNGQISLNNKDFSEENISKIIIEKFSGRFLGDLFVNINQNIPNVEHGAVKDTSNVLYYNDRNSITMQITPITSSEFLISESNRLKVDFIIIDNKLDNRFPLFENIFQFEDNYPYLEKEFEYISEKIDLHVKIFKINYDYYKENQE